MGDGVNDATALAGIEDAVVNYVTNTVSVSYDPSKVNMKEIRTFSRKLCPGGLGRS